MYVVAVEEGALKMWVEGDDGEYEEKGLPESIRTLGELQEVQEYGSPEGGKGVLFKAVSASGEGGIYSLALTVPGHRMELRRLDEDGERKEVGGWEVLPTGEDSLCVVYVKGGHLYTVVFDPSWEREVLWAEVETSGWVEQYRLVEGDEGVWGAVVVLRGEGWVLETFEIFEGRGVIREVVAEGLGDPPQVMIVQDEDGRHMVVMGGDEVVVYGKVANVWVEETRGVRDGAEVMGVWGSSLWMRGGDEVILYEITEVGGAERCRGVSDSLLFVGPLSPEGVEWLVVRDEDGVIRVEEWNVRTGEVRLVVRREVEGRRIVAPVWRGYVWWLEIGGGIRLVRYENGRIDERTWLGEEKDWVWVDGRSRWTRYAGGMVWAFVGEGKTLVSDGEGLSAIEGRVWDVSAGEEVGVRYLLVERDEALYKIEFSE